MTEALTIQTDSNNPWGEGNNWCFVAMDALGELIVRIEDSDWLHLRERCPSWLTPEEIASTAASELARLASACRPVIAAGKRSIDVLLR